MPIVIWYFLKQAYMESTLRNFKRTFRLDQEKIKPEVETSNTLYISVLTGSTLLHRILMNSAGGGFQKKNEMAPSLSSRKGLRASAVMTDMQWICMVISPGESLSLTKSYLEFQVCTLLNFCSNFLVELWKVIKGMVKVYLAFSCPVLHPRNAALCVAGCRKHGRNTLGWLRMNT